MKKLAIAFFFITFANQASAHDFLNGFLFGTGPLDAPSIVGRGGFPENPETPELNGDPARWEYHPAPYERKPTIILREENPYKNPYVPPTRPSPR